MGSLTVLQAARRFAFLTLLGLFAVVLVGPVVAVLAVILAVVLTAVTLVLPFAVAGFLVWAPYQFLVHDQHKAWARVRETAWSFYQALVVAPVGLCVRASCAGGRLCQATMDRARRLAGFLRGVALETVGGSFVGGLVGTVGGLMHEEIDVRLPLGLLFGAVIGLLIGATRTRGTRAPVVVKAVPRAS